MKSFTWWRTWTPKKNWLCVLASLPSLNITFQKCPRCSTNVLNVTKARSIFRFTTLSEFRSNLEVQLRYTFWFLHRVPSVCMSLLLSQSLTDNLATSKRNRVVHTLLRLTDSAQIQLNPPFYHTCLSLLVFNQIDLPL